MLKKIIVLMVILSVFLAACQSAASEPSAEPTAESPVEPETTSTDLPPLPEVSPTPGSEQATEQAEANCTVVSRQPPAGSTEPLVTDNDWTQGPDDAAVTFIEYSDFQ
jgi:PBP1b-binding outer membrane lipoprotein LpoB